MVASLRQFGTLDIPKDRKVQQGSSAKDHKSTHATSGSAPPAQKPVEPEGSHARHHEDSPKDKGQTSRHHTQESTRSEVHKANTGTVTGSAQTHRHQKTEQPQVKASNAQQPHDLVKKPSIEHIENIGAPPVAGDIQRGWSGHQASPVKKAVNDDTLAAQFTRVLGLNTVSASKAYDTRGKPSIPDGRLPEDSFGS